MTATRTDLPTGTVTFLRTDVEGSMGLARALGARWDALNAAQLGIVRAAVDSHGGVTVRTEGDAVFAVFADARAATEAAIAAQRAVEAHDWPAGGRARVRIGLHTGEAHLAGDDYGGFDVNRAARIASAGHGSQIVLSDPTRALVETDLPAGVMLRDLGRHALRDVPQPERLFQLEAPGLPTEFPPLRTATAVAGNVPARLTSFVGRDAELGALRDLLARSRLITITGPGGIGKTSLAVELARDRAPDFGDGAWLVALDTEDDPAAVPTAIARTLGLYDGPGRPVADRLATHLAERRTLLILDNFEHLLDAAPTVAELLRAAPGLRAVVTSRAPLHVGGEQEYPIGPLSRDGRDADAAVRLFADRARSVAPGWSPDPERPTVDEICRLLDGLPLGIELAAARVGLLPLAAIRDRLAARLPLPGAGRRDAPDRQRTLDGAIAWSYDLLPPQRRRLLRELAVFDGGFAVDQARAVASPGDSPADDVLDGLIDLTDQSLIERGVTGPGSAPGGLRFTMLETIRSFALAALARDGAEHEARRRHAAAFAELAEEAAPKLRGPELTRWVGCLADDHANLHAAVAWSVANGEVELAQRLAAALWRYWQLGGHLREGRALADAVLDMPGADAPTVRRVWSLGAAGGMAYWQGERERASRVYRQQFELARQLGDPAAEAEGAFNLSATEWIGGDIDEARSLIDRARELYDAVGDEVGSSRIEWARANMLRDDDPAEAMTIIGAARRRYEANGDAMYLALSAGNVAWAHARRGEFRQALRWGIESMVGYHGIGAVPDVTLAIATVAAVAVDLDEPDAGATLMGAFERSCEVHGVRAPAGLDRLIRTGQPLERARHVLGAERFAAAVERGRRMSLDEAVTYAEQLGRRVLGDELAAGDPNPSPRLPPGGPQPSRG